MKIDRQRFLALALGMASPLVGCGGASERTEVRTTPTTQSSQQSTAVVVECIDWSPSGACLSYGQVAVAPTAEAYAPTSECTGWDANATCVEWEDTTSSPTAECVDWDPTGECIGWS